MTTMNANKEYFLITKNDLCAGLDKARTEWAIAAPMQKHEDGRKLYDYIKNSSEILWEYMPTVLPLKKFFFPQTEALLEYNKSSGEVKAAKVEIKPTVLFGVTPCDLNGLKLLTEAFSDDHGDPSYLARREKAILIGIDCKKICDKHAFCFKVNAHNAVLGSHDVMLYEIDRDHYLVSSATDKGKNFFAKYFTMSKTKGDEFVKFAAQKAEGFAKEHQFPDLYQFPDIFSKNEHHPIWKQEGDRCLSCGSCIMVCPTCYCFDVKDELELNLKSGKRIRKWDACMLDCFAVVAGGENFRGKAIDRLRHRINRKFNYLFRKHGESLCVGCGRCVRACLADISPRTIAAAIVNDKEESV